jgi:hypothetical protein
MNTRAFSLDMSFAQSGGMNASAFSLT